MSGNRKTRSQRKSSNVGKQKGYAEVECQKLKPSRRHSFKKGLFNRRKCIICGKSIPIKKAKKREERQKRTSYVRSVSQKIEEAFDKGESERESEGEGADE